MSDPRRQPKRARPKSPTTVEGWWYEEVDGLHVLARTTDGVSTYVVLPWRTVLNAARRSSGKEVSVRE